MAIPKTMKAAILVELGKPLVIDEIELPQTLEVGQVLVKIHFSGICGSQLGEIDGAKGEDKFLPHLLGHEASGTVVEIGPGVKYVKPGDTVVLHWMKGSGLQSNTPHYKNKKNLRYLTETIRRELNGEITTALEISNALSPVTDKAVRNAMRILKEKGFIDYEPETSPQIYKSTPLGKYVNRMFVMELNEEE